MRRHKYNMRTYLFSLPESHSGFYTGFLGKTAFSQYDSMPCLWVPANSYGLAPQFRVIQKLNARIAAVHIRMQYYPVHAYFTRFPAIFLLTSSGVYHRRYQNICSIARDKLQKSIKILGNLVSTFLGPATVNSAYRAQTN